MIVNRMRESTADTSRKENPGQENEYQTVQSIPIRQIWGFEPHCEAAALSVKAYPDNFGRLLRDMMPILRYERPNTMELPGTWAHDSLVRINVTKDGLASRIRRCDPSRPDLFPMCKWKCGTLVSCG